MKGHTDMKSVFDTVKVADASFHRNGVAGEGFTVRLIDDTYDGEPVRLVTITFDSDPMRTAVLDVDLLADGVIAFGENSWRGDHYALALGLTKSGERASMAFGSRE